MDISKLKDYQQGIIYRLIGKYELLNDTDLPTQI